jgi:hypothetical protein
MNLGVAVIANVLLGKHSILGASPNAGVLLWFYVCQQAIVCGGAAWPGVLHLCTVKTLSTLKPQVDSFYSKQHICAAFRRLSKCLARCRILW